MNKLFKRMIVCVLMVCLLSALMVPAAVSAETADPYVIDFKLDTMEDLVWNNGQYTFAGTNFPHGNASWVTCFNNYYRDGTINFSFPHTIHTKESAEAAGDAKLNGKVANNLTFMSHEKNPTQFGSYMYNNANNTLAFTGLKLQPASTTYNTSGYGWNAVLLRAPADVGTYDISLTYGKYTGIKDASFFMLPYTAEMKAMMESDVAAWNAYICDIVAQGAEADSYLTHFNAYASAWSTATADMGQVTVDMDTTEYLFIIYTAAGGGFYLQDMTFTPAAEQEIPVEIATRNYSFVNAVKSTVILQNADFTVNTDGVATVEALYDAGTIDWSWLGTNSKDNIGQGVELQKGYLYNQNVLMNVTGTENDTNAYEAYKLRSPGAGKYNISFDCYVAANNKSAAWSDVYIAEYTEGMDPLSIVTEENYVGAHTPKSSVTPAAGKTAVTAVGEFEFAEGKEYILVHKADGEKYGWPTSAVDVENDRHYTANFYMRGFVIEPQVAPPTFVPKAYIGTTPYGTVAAAAAAAKSGDTIKLAVDFIGNIDLPAGVSLDLNGNDWTVTSLTTTNAAEAVIDSVGTGNLIAKSIDLYGSNTNVLPLANGANSYTLAGYTMTVVENDYEVVGDATRFWFKLDLEDAYLDMIAAGNTGLTLGVELDWGGAEGLAVTFDNGNGAEAFAAEWAAAAKAGTNVWLYVDITGIENLSNDLTVTPVLQVSDSALNNGSLVYAA